MDAQFPQAPQQDWDFWSQGLNRQFFAGVYKQSTQLTVLAVLLLLGFEQKAAAGGVICGAGVGLFSLWTVEMTVRLLFNGGRFAGAKLAVGACLKLPFLIAGLLGIAWAGQRGIINIFAVVGGALLVHATMLVSVIATAVANQDRNRERYR